ncbi:MAG: paraslipin, partial [Gammaproteobacteria bacterium]|nr:paraslipin [Gammaproteobacteria bacterium]
AGLTKVADALNADGGDKAMQLRVAENYLERFGSLAKEGNTLIVPANLSDMTSMIGAATRVLEATKGTGEEPRSR